MSKSTREITKSPKKRAVVTGDPVLVRVQPDMAKQLDDWRRKQDDLPGRPEAIRRLVEIGLKVQPISNERSRRGRSLDLGTMAKIEPAANAARSSRAAELAAAAIDKIADSAVPPEERDERRRRLTKGPPEFREVRVDRPKAKTK
jgi:hypothetical protein